MKLGLEKKRAIVGGSSKGRGFAVARSLLEEGAEVVIAARNADILGKAGERLEKETGRRPLVIPADLTKPKGQNQHPETGKFQK